MRYPTVSKNFKQALSDKNMTQQKLSEISGIGKSSISQYCNGSHCPDNIRALKIAEILNVNPLWLMGLSDNKNPVDAQTLSEVQELFSQAPREVRDSVLTILKSYKPRS